MTIEHTRDWTDQLLAFAPLVAVAVAIGVALVQANLQRQNLKQTLYERRFRVYRSVIEFWHNIIESSGSPKVEMSNHFYAEISHAKFLFGSDVITFLEEYYALTQKIQTTVGPRFPKSDTEALYEELGRLAGPKNEDVFRPYLQLYHEQGWLTRCKGRLDRWMDSVDASMKYRSQSR